MYKAGIVDELLSNREAASSRGWRENLDDPASDISQRDHNAAIYFQHCVNMLSLKTMIINGAKVEPYSMASKDESSF